MQQVEIYKGDLRTGSFLLAKGLERDHDNIRKLIEKYRVHFENFSDLKRRKLKSTGGRAANEYMLDEDQFMFLGTLLKNTEKVVAFKYEIIQQFKKCRIELHKHEPTYQITREAGKLVRRQETDTIKIFIQYAKKQGGSEKGCDMYYSNITKMMNSLLFIAESNHKTLRDMLTVNQLMTVSSAEQIIDNAINLGMRNNKYYKDIYKDVKSKVEIFAELHGQSHIMLELQV